MIQLLDLNFVRAMLQRNGNRSIEPEANEHIMAVLVPLEDEVEVVLKDVVQVEAVVKVVTEVMVEDTHSNFYLSLKHPPDQLIFLVIPKGYKM